MTTIHYVPADLKRSGIQLWNSIANRWDLRPDELEILHSACRCRDTIDELTAGMAGEGLTAKGSMGQPVINPILQERRFQEQAMANLLAKLKLPDDLADAESASVFGNDRGPSLRAVAGGSDRPMTRSEVGRKGASARWDGRYGGA